MQVGAFRGLNLAAKATLHYVRLVTSLAVFLENRFPEGAHIGHTRDTAVDLHTGRARPDELRGMKTAVCRV